MNRVFDIKLGYECNNNCCHCIVQEKRKINITKNLRFSTKEIFLEIDKAKKNGFQEICLTGGEPTLRTDLAEIINYAKINNFTIILQSNGRLFSYEEYAKKISKYNIRFGIAIHGNSEKIHDLITRTPNSFNQTMTGIQNLIKNKQQVITKTVISKKNYKFLPKLTKLLIDSGIKSINLSFLRVCYDQNDFIYENVPKYHKIIHYLEDCCSLIEKHNIKKPNQQIEMIISSVPYCLSNKIIPHLTTPSITYPKIISRTKEGYCDAILYRLAKKTKINICEECKYNDICEGFGKEYSRYYGVNEFNPVK